MVDGSGSRLNDPFTNSEEAVEWLGCNPPDKRGPTHTPLECFLYHWTHWLVSWYVVV